MPAGKYNIIIEQGANFSRIIGWKHLNDTPIDITDYTIRMMARVAIDDASPVISLATVQPPGGITITNGPGGQFQISMNAAATGALDFNEALYDLEMVSPVGLVTRLLEGTITLKREVTR
jgi:hypothetical protein